MSGPMQAERASAATSVSESRSEPERGNPNAVVAGLAPPIHAADPRESLQLNARPFAEALVRTAALGGDWTAWMAGSSPAMTKRASGLPGFGPNASACEDALIGSTIKTL